ncbi:MAG: enoyl-[acyl-carrier-protein] reductase FabK [Bacillota bacterium]|nr:enoyl-[acyl-carrier-protein] reductase FabK [Bacillota bacterium]
MIKTELCELLGIEYPIIQGGMAWVADAELAAAVSEAGGLGLIAAANAPPDWVRNEIKKARSLTKKQFGINIMLLSPYTDQVAALAVEEAVPVITTGAGSPAKYMKDWINAGIKVLPVVASCALAKRMQRMGASAVIAEGGESGGHIGELTTMALVPQVVDSIQIPVVAAGGIADGRGVAAALVLGAAGVQVGTRFLVATECTIHENYKKKILAAEDIDTMVTGRRLGHPVRALKNPFMRSFAEKEKDENVTLEELENYGVGGLRKAAREGDMEWGCVMAGQICGLVKKEEPAKDIITSMFEEAEAILKGACGRWIR